MTLQEKRGLKRRFSPERTIPSKSRTHPRGGAVWNSISSFNPCTHTPQCYSCTCITPNTALINKRIFIFSCKRFYLQNHFGPALSRMFLEAVPDLGSDCPTDTGSRSRTWVPPPVLGISSLSCFSLPVEWLLSFPDVLYSGCLSLLTCSLLSL